MKWQIQDAVQVRHNENCRHCEEHWRRSNPHVTCKHGLLRCARNDVVIIISLTFNRHQPVVIQNNPSWNNAQKEADNGSEFARLSKVIEEKNVYYTHCLANYERGTNKNQNRMILRFFTVRNQV